jgi:hypothetical protein
MRELLVTELSPQKKMAPTMIPSETTAPVPLPYRPWKASTAKFVARTLEKV